MSYINCRISKRQQGFEGTVSIPGLRSTKLLRSSDNTSFYTTRSGVVQSAKAIANRFGMGLKINNQTWTTSHSNHSRRHSMA